MKKYIPVFGDQSLFDNAPKDAVFVRYGKESYIFKKHIHRYTTRSLRNVPIVAMRRIEEVADSKLVTDGMPSFYVGSSGVCTHKFAESDIPVWCNDVDDTCTAMGFINDYLRLPRKPKRWTVADQQAGRLPEVFALVKPIAAKQSPFLGVDMKDRSLWVFQGENGFVFSCLASRCEPIETPEHYSKAFGEALQAKIDVAVRDKSLQQEKTIEDIDRLIEPEFNEWWDKHGQFIRTGGGEYERTFAFGAFRYLMPRILGMEKPKPKRWTMEDQKAGRLPEIDAELKHNRQGICTFVGIGFDGFWALKTKAGEIYIADKKHCHPIETPDEKIVRLEDEYLNEIAKFFPEFDVATARFLYRAQLAGGLSAPAQAKDGEQ